NLSSNRISIIEPGAFQGLINLRKIDLSYNRIGTIDSAMFLGLPKLEKLSLDNNRINTLPDGTFNDLISLRKVEFGSNFLRCDCHLKWMVKWSKSKSVRIPPSTVCALPKAMKGQVFNKLKRSDLHCDHDLQLPYFEITPHHSQVVFEGDKLPFECSASVIHTKTNITWIRGQKSIISNKTAGIFVHTQYTPDKTRITHSLVVENLDKSHSGQWYCQVATPQGKVSQGVNISVISNQAVYCPEVVKVTGKGNYSWEKTVAGIEVSQPCKSPKNKVALYKCNRYGYWEELDVMSCSYMNEMTRQLERLATVNYNSTDIYDHLADFERIYSSPKNEFGVMDVVFLARIVEKLQDHLSVSSEISQIIVDKISSISTLEDSVLRGAQLQEQASTRYAFHCFRTVNESYSSAYISITVLLFLHLISLHPKIFRFIFIFRFVRVIMNITNMAEIQPPNKEWSKYSQNINISVLQEPRDDLARIQESFVMQPVIYVGSCLCMLCMMIVIISYITCFRVIFIPKKLKHSVINICISIHLLIVAFTLGINRTDLELACQISGICIHYLTLCTVFWITITSNNMYKKFTKGDKPSEPPPELINMPLPPKPILRFYFLGWGVPIIICGITAAVNFNHYSGIKYCFLSWEPSLGAFYGPIALLVVLNLLFFLRISCVIRGAAINNSDGEDCTEELHVNEIELIPKKIKDSEDDDEDDDNKSSISVMDQERRPITQLRAIVAMLFLYILAWVCGAVAIAKPFQSIIPYQELIFSYLYGVTSTILGVFMVVYFCFSRQDSRLSW
ncbi:hypothetical protein LOTGIDRAFT_140702, partial [Lottia gigantea]